MATSEILLETGTNELEILEFYIDETSAAGEQERVYFGMNVAKVMQVIENPNLAPCDYAQHPSFLGVIPLREHILPIIDLSVWLGMDRTDSNFDLIIATEFSQAVNGFLVSGVTEILRVGWGQVKPPGTFLSKFAKAAIIGTVEHDNRFIQLLDMESIISDLDPNMMKDAGISEVRAKQQYPVLIADDSQTILDMVTRNLRAANFRPITASNGQEAWDLLCKLRERAENEHLDIHDLVRIVISDIEMPMLDGFTLTKRIKEDPQLGKIPVILYSSIITDELRHKGEFVKADDQVSKPELHEMARRAIDLIEAAAAAATVTV
ncbi:MAG: chemotaxis protein [Desulfuromonadaceae bacterium]|nr:chemotaxis protein [Desulfuromonadaceae bacterium]MDD5105268.1 chemotaxis protein [Desulfuromonadaceae bacterium]